MWMNFPLSDMPVSQWGHPEHFPLLVHQMQLAWCLQYNVPMRCSVEHQSHLRSSKDVTSRKRMWVTTWWHLVVHRHLPFICCFPGPCRWMVSTWYLRHSFHSPTGIGYCFEVFKCIHSNKLFPGPKVSLLPSQGPDLALENCPDQVFCLLCSSSTYD